MRDLGSHAINRTRGQILHHFYVTMSRATLNASTVKKKLYSDLNCVFCNAVRLQLKCESETSESGFIYRLYISKVFLYSYVVFLHLLFHMLGFYFIEK